MPGLIETNINKEDPLKSVVGYNPERIKLEDEDTVQARIQGIIEKNSPLIQMSGTRTKQEFNARGLKNSSMAVQTGEAGVYQSALPIASRDADASLAVKQANQAAGNAAQQYTASATNTAIGQQLAGQQQKEAIAATGSEQRKTTELTGEQTLEQISAQTTSQMAINAAENAATIERMGVDLQNNLVLAQKSGDIAAIAAAQKQVDDLVKLKQQQDYAVTLSTMTGEQQIANIAAQTTGQMAINAKQNEAIIERDILAQKNNLELAKQAGDIAAIAATQKQIDNLEILSVQQGNAVALTNIQQENAVALQNLSNDQQLALAELNNTYNKALQNSAAAVSLYGYVMQTLSAIGANPDLSPEQRQAGTDDAINTLHKGLNFVNTLQNGEWPIFDTDVSGTSTDTGTGTGTSTGGWAPNTNPVKVGPQQESIISTPGSYVGEVKTVKVNDGTSGRSVWKDVKIQWTASGWVVI